MEKYLIGGAIALSVLSVFFLIFLFLIKPCGKRRERMKRFTEYKYAHRGLHDATRAENSLSAFKAAVEAGYAIELDVRLSSDGELVVFHDDTLERVTDKEGRVDERSAKELSEIHLMGTNDTIPTFAEVLSVVDGRVPLLVEIKEDAMKYGVTEKTAEMLRTYKGEFIVESFNPLALSLFKKLMPDTLRGVLSQNFLSQKKYRKPMYFLLENLLLNVACRPDFIAFNHTDHKNCALRLTKKLFRTTTVAWTIRSKEEEEKAYKNGFSTVIFENYEA